MGRRSRNPIRFRPIDTWPGAPLLEEGERTQHQFKAEWNQTLWLLSDEVDHLADDAEYETLIVVQLAVAEREIRRDESSLLANVEPAHPGVVVSFDAARGPLRFSCDRFTNRYYSGMAGWRANLRAIALALSDLRRVDRYGIGRGGEQYTGFGALPPGAPLAMGAAMTVDEAALLIAEHAMDPSGPMRDSDARAELRRRLIAGEGIALAYRVAAKRNHPDSGGDAEVFRRLTQARDLLLAHAG